MNAPERREQISSILTESTGPVSASVLAARFGVSRQIVVGDIALLRAAGVDILATPRGYIVAREHVGLTRTIACLHTPEQTEDELNIIVDNGCTALDVIIEHPVYGQMTGELRLSCRRDVVLFTQRISSQGGAPLSVLTGGIHLHTLICPDQEAYERTRDALAAAGYLLPDSD